MASSKLCKLFKMWHFSLLRDSKKRIDLSSLTESTKKYICFANFEFVEDSKAREKNRRTSSHIKAFPRNFGMIHYDLIIFTAKSLTQTFNKQITFALTNWEAARREGNRHNQTLWPLPPSRSRFAYTHELH